MFNASLLCFSRPEREGVVPVLLGVGGLALPSPPLWTGSALPPSLLLLLPLPDRAVGASQGGVEHD